MIKSFYYWTNDHFLFNFFFRFNTLLCFVFFVDLTSMTKLICKFHILCKQFNLYTTVWSESYQKIHHTVIPEKLILACLRPKINWMLAPVQLKVNPNIGLFTQLRRRNSPHELVHKHHPVKLLHLPIDFLCQLNPHTNGRPLADQYPVVADGFVPEANPFRVNDQPVTRHGKAFVQVEEAKILHQRFAERRDLHLHEGQLPEEFLVGAGVWVTVHLLRHAHDLGLDEVLILVPHFYRKKGKVVRRLSHQGAADWGALEGETDVRFLILENEFFRIPMLDECFSWFRQPFWSASNSRCRCQTGFPGMFKSNIRKFIMTIIFLKPLSEVNWDILEPTWKYKINSSHSSSIPTPDWAKSS